VTVMQVCRKEVLLHACVAVPIDALIEV